MPSSSYSEGFLSSSPTPAPGPQAFGGDYGDNGDMPFAVPFPWYNDGFHSHSPTPAQVMLLFFGDMAGLMLFGFVLSCFVKSTKDSTMQESQPGNKTIIAAPLPTVIGVNLVEVRELDAETMERFLHNMAKEITTRFTAEELQIFTNNYSTRLGSGAFGVVYKGWCPNGIKIAVKVLNKNPNSKKVEEQFMAEVGTIGKIYHINLVRLYGYCFDQRTSSLVYEFMENKSLDKFLFSNKAQQIEWEKLQEISIGTAKGLAYLHEECQQRIMHYDIKTGNILLDLNMSPKVADFGLAKLCSRDNTHVSVSGYRGTPGYSAPEFLMHNYPITHKCDVYSFGMLLFEIARRKRNTETDLGDSVDWFPKKAWEEYEKGELKDLITAEINEIKEKDKDKVERMIVVALWCVQDSPYSRPLMSTVVKMLEGGIEILSPPNPFRYLYGSHTGYVTGGTLGANSYSTTTRNTSSQNKNTISLMREYETQIVIS